MKNDIMTTGVEQTNELDQTRKRNIARQAMSIEHITTSTDIEVDLGRATKLPLASVESLGAAFSSLPEAFRTVTQTVDISGEGLLRATDRFGNPLDTNILQAFNDGTGLMGSFRDELKGFGQARLHEVSSQTAEIVTKVPYDPTTLFIAAALMEVSKKLDDIQETQQEMFEYIRNKDKAELRGNLETLSDVLNNYRFNWNNQQYKSNKHVLVQNIRSSAEKSIIQHRAGIKGQLKKKGFVHSDKDVRKKTAAVRSELEECRLAVYLYAFSSFLEVMLLENFEAPYLASITEKIDEYSINYRELYTQAYDLIEADADSSVRAMALGGLSGAMNLLGKAIEKTPVGDRTLIDETLQDASKDLTDFSKDIKHGMMSKLTDARSSDVRPFIDNIETVSRLYNEPVMLLADNEALYVLPVEEESFLNEGNETSENR